MNSYQIDLKTASTLWEMIQDFSPEDAEEAITFALYTAWQPLLFAVARQRTAQIFKAFEIERGLYGTHFNGGKIIARSSYPPHISEGGNDRGMSQ